MADYDIILLTEDRYENPAGRDWYTLQLLLEDELLVHAIEQQGMRVKRVSWSNPQFDWHSTDAVMFKSTWDYFDRYAEFSNWLQQIKGHLKVINPMEIIEWNLNKKYLLELRERGLNIVRSEVVERNTTARLEDYFEHFSSEEIIIKPLVSGAARNTFRLTRSDANNMQQKFDQLLQAEGYLIQPFQRSITAQGEISLMVMDGTFTHAVRKIAKQGDFRVQDDFGGIVQAYHPSAAEIDFAERAVAACTPQPLYARVDVVTDNAGQPALMELELIEPEMFFRFSQTATFKLAAALQRHLR